MGKKIMIEEIIKQEYEQMFPAEKKVADFILKNMDKVVDMNVAELGEQSETSEATVIRICRRLGFKGFYHFKISLAKEGSNRQLLGYYGPQDEQQTVHYILQETVNNILNLDKYLNISSIITCAQLLRGANMVHVIATGNTTPVAQDFAFRLGRMGIRSNCSFVPEYSLGNIQLGQKEDVAIAISHSGSSISVIQAVELAQKRGMKVIAITDEIQSAISKYATVTLATPIRKNLYKGFGAASNVHTLVVLDVLLYFVGNLEKTTKEIDDLELLLAEYKL